MSVSIVPFSCQELITFGLELRHKTNTKRPGTVASTGYVLSLSKHRSNLDTQG